MENKISKEQIKINLEKLYNEKSIQLNKSLRGKINSILWKMQN